MDIRQSPLYAKFMQSLGWKVEKISKWNAFIKNFPIIGSFIKIQRINSPLPEKEIVKLAKRHRAFKVIIEPIKNSEFPKRMSLRSPAMAGLKQSRSGSPCPSTTLGARDDRGLLNFKRVQYLNEIYSPSKTIHIDLTPSKQEIFNRFSPSKRRAIRRAEKNKVIVKESSNIEAFIKLKSKQMFPLGFLMKKEINALWQACHPKNAIVLLAKYYNNTYYCSKTAASVLILFWGKTAYYWMAATTKKGKKLFAPTLLVWEALKLAKRRGAATFDFEGIYDPRFPKATKSWQGFTKFKKGFGGYEVKYPRPFMI